MQYTALKQKQYVTQKNTFMYKVFTSDLNDSEFAEISL